MPGSFADAAWNERIIADFHEHAGQITLGRLAGANLLLMTSIGARSGEPRTAPLGYTRDGDRYVVVGSNSGQPRQPIWLANIRANPIVSVEVGVEMFRARATITTGAERERLWAAHVAALPHFATYEDMTERELQVVTLEPVAADAWGPSSGGIAPLPPNGASMMEVRSTRRDPWPLVGSLCALGFLIVAAFVARGGSLQFDEAVASAIQGLPIPRAFWEACSRAGGGTLVVVGVSFVLLAVITRRPRLALIVAVTLIVASLFTDIVKDLVARPRPPGAVLTLTSGFSFPSGHALTSTATYGLLAVVVWRSELPRTLRLIVAVAVGVTLPILVGLSRVALDVHYPSDVLAGWLAGTVFVALAATLISTTGAMERTDRRR